MSPHPLEDIQGNILRGYRMPTVRHFILSIETPSAAKQVLNVLLSEEEREGSRQDLRITTAAPWETKPVYCLNIAFTFAGLQALGLPQEALTSFPPEFQAGAASRANTIGDVGESAPQHWLHGLAGTPDSPPQVHILLSLYACDRPTLETLSTALRHLFTLEGAMKEHSCQDGEALPNSRVHFGYVDGLSQPHVDGAEPPKCACPQDTTPTGDFLLGYEGYYGTYPLPQPERLGNNGTFCAYRVLSQDVVGFETYLEQAAAETKLDKELIAAKMCGRWRNGVPLALSPETDRPDPRLTHEQMNAFDYRPTRQHPDANDDWQGFRCPVGSHIRRSNPRSQDVAGLMHATETVNGEERVIQSGSPRRIIRRGIPYGPLYHPNTKRGPAKKEPEAERGLLLLILCASLRDQFEFLMTQWINGENFTGVTVPKDPLFGNFPEGESKFFIPMQGQKAVELKGFPRFVGTCGAAYGFIPSISALRYLAQPSYCPAEPGSPSRIV